MDKTLAQQTQEKASANLAIGGSATSSVIPVKDTPLQPLTTQDRSIRDLMDLAAQSRATTAPAAAPTTPSVAEPTDTTPVATTQPADSQESDIRALMQKAESMRGSSYDANKGIRTATGGDTSTTKPVAIRDLYTDKYQKTQRDYLKLFSGAVVDKMTNEEVTDTYISRMRNWTAANSYTVAEEMYKLWNFNDTQRATAGEAYKLFDNTESIFNENSSWGDTFSGLYEYTKAVIIDPTNIAALFGGAGIATRLGTKGAGVVARGVATKAATRVLEQSLAKGVEKTAAKALSAQAYNKVFQKAMVRAGTTGTLKKEATKKLIGETAIDTALSFGVDYAQQSGMIMTGAQDEYSALQGGLTAFGGLSAGFIDYGLRGARLASKTVMDKELAKTGGTSLSNLAGNFADLKAAATKTSKQAAKQAAPDIVLNLDHALKTLIADPMKAMSPWKDKVKVGKNVAKNILPDDHMNDVDFWKYFFLGNDAAGVKGLVRSVLDAGIEVPAKGAGEEGIMDYFTNVVLNLPKPYKDKMAESFRQTVGKNIPAYSKLSNEAFAGKIAMEFSKFGQGLNIASQMRQMANNFTTITAEEAVTDIVGKTPPSMASKFMGRTMKVQEQFLRAVTTHPGTVALNAKGHFMVMQIDYAADITRAALHYGLGFLSKSQAEQAKAIKNSLVYRAASYINPTATHQDYMNIISIHPDLMKKFSSGMYGGVDKVVDKEDFIKRYGFDPDDKTLFAKWMKTSDKYIEFFQTAYAAKAVDSWTKSTAYMGQLDKHLRLTFGADVGVNRFFNDPKLLTNIRTQDYLKVQAKAYEETMREVMSFAADRSKNADMAEKVAAFVESLSKYPLIGALVPFGKFFNNTIRTMSDLTGGSAVMRIVGATANGMHKMVGGDGNVFALSSRDTADLMAKGAVGWTAILSFMESYASDHQKGLRYDQVMDDNGNIETRQSEYPENFFRAAAAMLYHTFKGDGVPAELASNIATTFGPGQLTRSFSDQEKGLIGAFNGAVDFAINPDTAESMSTIGPKLLEAMNVSTYISGGMRPLDPINHLAAIARGPDYQPIDRNEGIKVLNTSLRYVDQIIAGMTDLVTGTPLELAPKKNLATTTADIKVEPLRIFSINTMPPMSNTEAVFNKIGRNMWNTTIKSKSPEANNRVNAFVAPFLEIEMKILNDNKSFDSRPQKDKEAAVKNALTRAKNRALEAMGNSLTVDDVRMKQLFKMLSKHNATTVNEAIVKLMGKDGPTDIHDMTIQQLDILENYISVEQDRLKRQ